jgi:membrane-associated phospholipid phosphatase
MKKINTFITIKKHDVATYNIKKKKIQNDFVKQPKRNVVIKTNNHINNWVYIIYNVFLLASLLTVILFEKNNIHIFLNKFHTPFLDFSFKYITYLGDGIMFAFFIIFFFFVNKKESLKYVIAGLLTLIISAITKRLVFINSARPVEVLGKENLHLIEGVKMAHWQSFPSGHTMTAFVIAVLLITHIKNKQQQLFIAFCALLAGLSRVYLSQHFLIDIFAGSMIGVVLALLVNLIMNKIKKNN